jgi:hypothetical protein
MGRYQTHAIAHLFELSASMGFFCASHFDEETEYER